MQTLHQQRTERGEGSSSVLAQHSSAVASTFQPTMKTQSLFKAQGSLTWWEFADMSMTDRPLGRDEPEAGTVLWTELCDCPSLSIHPHIVPALQATFLLSPLLSMVEYPQEVIISISYFSILSAKLPAPEECPTLVVFNIKLRHKVEKNKEMLEHWCGSVSGSWPYTELHLSKQTVESSILTIIQIHFSSYSPSSPNPPFLIEFIRTLQKWQEVHLHFYQKVSKKTANFVTQFLECPSYSASFIRRNKPQTHKQANLLQRDWCKLRRSSISFF